MEDKEEKESRIVEIPQHPNSVSHLYSILLLGISYPCFLVGTWDQILFFLDIPH